MPADQSIGEVLAGRIVQRDDDVCGAVLIVASACFGRQRGFAQPLQTRIEARLVGQPVEIIADDLLRRIQQPDRQEQPLLFPQRKT